MMNLKPAVGLFLQPYTFALQKLKLDDLQYSKTLIFLKKKPWFKTEPLTSNKTGLKNDLRGGVDILMELDIQEGNSCCSSGSDLIDIKFWVHSSVRCASSSFKS